MEAVQILFAAGGDLRHEFLRRDADFFGGDHDWCAVGVVSADEIDFMALHSLEPDPDVSLDVLHDVADMERCIGVRQGGSDK